MLTPAPLNVAIIGCGVIGPAHAESYLRCPEVRVAVACDRQPQRAEALARRFGDARVETDAARVFADPGIDAVSICTDHASHAALVIAALEAGKHVLCEKALATSSADLDRMTAAAARQPRLVAAGVLQHRFDPTHRLARTLIQEAALGTLLTASLRMCCKRTDEYYRMDKWRGTWAEEGGSLLINQAIHYVDQLAWIAGGVEAVAAQIANRTHQGVIETEDTAVAALRLRHGALGSIAATSSSHLEWEAILTFNGHEGLLELRNGSLSRAEFADPLRQAEVQHRFTALADPQAASSAKAYYGPSHPSQVADFVDAIRESRPPEVSLAQARAPVDLVLGIYESARTGRWVELPKH